MTKAEPVTRGRFLTFEGGEGSGKSTQLRLLAERLAAAGIDVITTREPGGSPGAEVIRYLLLSGVGQCVGPDAEALLFAAARDDHVHNVIAPALERGTWVICDRFADSTRVYQGKLGNVDPMLIDALERVTIGDLEPDLTFMLDVPAEVGIERAAKRRKDAQPDRFEAEGKTFHIALREAYLELARDNPERCIVIDANRPESEISQAIWDAMATRLLPDRQAAGPRRGR